MGKKQTFIIPVFFKVKAKSYNEAELAVVEAINNGLVETVCSSPPEGVKNWAFDTKELQT